MIKLLEGTHMKKYWHKRCALKDIFFSWRFVLVSAISSYMFRRSKVVGVNIRITYLWAQVLPSPHFATFGFPFEKLIYCCIFCLEIYACLFYYYYFLSSYVEMKWSSTFTAVAYWFMVRFAYERGYLVGMLVQFVV